MGENNSVKRSLYYYDLIWKRLDRKNAKFVTVKNLSTRFSDFIDGFSLKKGKRVNKDYILKTEKGDEIFIIKDSDKKEYVEFRIVLCKTNALPLIESDGTLEELEEYISSSQNIAELTHCVFFKKTCIIGAEFNFSGARVSALSWYMKKILFNNGDQETYTLKVEPKINNDAYKSLDKNETFTLFEIAFKPDSDVSRDIFSNKSIFNGLISGMLDSDVVEVVLKRKKNKKNKFIGLNNVLSADEIKFIIEQYRDDMKKFKLSQGSYSDKVDLLADKLVGRVDIIKTTKRTISSKDAYKKITNFYNEQIK